MSVTNEVSLSKQGDGNTLDKDILVPDRRDWGFLLEFQRFKAATTADNPLRLSLGNHVAQNSLYKGQENL